MEQINIEINEIKQKIDIVMKRQEEISNTLAENNVLLRRNIGLFQTKQTLFPIESEDELKNMEENLASDERLDIVSKFIRLH